MGDIGGGRLPRVDQDFIRINSLQYHLFDISRAELERADNRYLKIEMDVACSDAEFDQLHVPQNFDLIFSHMLLEHLPDPMQAHRNFFRMLRPGGLSVHMFRYHQGRAATYCGQPSDPAKAALKLRAMCR